MQIRPNNVRVFESSGVSQSSCCSGPSATSAPAASKVQVSGSAQQLSELRRTVEDADEVRAGKVAELKQQVQNGSYQPNLEGLADLLAQKLS